MHDLIVIGAGPGGYEAAAHAGELGKRVQLVEAGSLGGACLNVGCIPAKVFLRSSRLYRECTEAGPFGVRVAGASFDVPVVVERKNRIVAALKRGVEAKLKGAGVEVVIGRARLVDRHLVQVGDDRLEAENVLIATGSRPAVPPIPGIGAEHVLDSDRVFDVAEVPSSIAIIGGGYIGLELATYFREAGAEVAVFEMLPQIAANCDGEVSARLLQALQRSGIEFHLSCRVLSVEEGVLRYDDGSGTERTHAAERILNATGRAPVVAGLGLDEVGIDFSLAGVRISDRGETSVPGLWACGDVTGRHMLAHAATREGIVAVNSMFGIPDRIRYEAIPAVIYTHPEVAMAGRTEAELTRAGIPFRKATVPMGVAGRFLIENEGGSGFVKVLVGARGGEILGVHAVGDSSSEFIVAASALIETALTARQAAEVVFPHPTVSEALREAILKVG
ncbi:MAG: dihydrolipoyl dehydrogenase [Candidatus Dormibacteria bacterium]